ncbi:MAG: tetratricopeptide repeat protein [Deltaproteobacteria bacterium]|nr:tetratricopeptide repeat protein [Deltaproteobacteria bacterium]
MDLKELSAEGNEFFQKGDYARAKERFLEVIGAGYRFADVYNKLGLIFCDNREYEQAVKYFEEALKINPKYTEVSLNLSVTYNELGKYGKAREVYAKAKETAEAEAKGIDPFVKGKLANLHFNTGEIYHEMGLLDEALSEYTRALDLRPELVDVRVKIGIAYRDKGFIDKAIHEFKEAKIINPSYAAAGINLGITYYSLSKFKLAEEEWLEVQKKHPGNKTVAMYLRLLQRKQ